MSKTIVFLLIFFVLVLMFEVILHVYKSIWNKPVENFYIKDETLYINALFTKKILLSDIKNIEFSYSPAFKEKNYIRKIKVYKKDNNIVENVFQTSQLKFSVSEKMILDEIKKITPILKDHSVPYSIKKNK